MTEITILPWIAATASVVGLLLLLAIRIVIRRSQDAQIVLALSGLGLTLAGLMAGLITRETGAGMFALLLSALVILLSIVSLIRFRVMLRQLERDLSDTSPEGRGTSQTEAKPNGSPARVEVDGGEGGCAPQKIFGNSYQRKLIRGRSSLSFMVGWWEAVATDDYLNVEMLSHVVFYWIVWATFYKVELNRFFGIVCLPGVGSCMATAAKSGPPSAQDRSLQCNIEGNIIPLGENVQIDVAVGAAYGGSGSPTFTVGGQYGSVSFSYPDSSVSYSDSDTWIWRCRAVKESSGRVGVSTGGHGD